MFMRSGSGVCFCCSWRALRVALATAFLVTSARLSMNWSGSSSRFLKDFASSVRP